MERLAYAKMSRAFMKTISSIVYSYPGLVKAKELAPPRRQPPSVEDQRNRYCHPEFIGPLGEPVQRLQLHCPDPDSYDRGIRVEITRLLDFLASTRKPMYASVFMEYGVLNVAVWDDNSI